jgi:hypothetical protein
MFAYINKIDHRYSSSAIVFNALEDNTMHEENTHLNMRNIF